MIINPENTADAQQLAKDLLAAAGDHPERVRTNTQGARLAFDVDDDLARAVGRTPDEQATPGQGFDTQRVAAAQANAGRADQDEQAPQAVTQTLPDGTVVGGAGEGATGNQPQDGQAQDGQTQQDGQAQDAPQQDGQQGTAAGDEPVADDNPEKPAGKRGKK